MRQFGPAAPRRASYIDHMKTSAWHWLLRATAGQQRPVRATPWVAVAPAAAVGARSALAGLALGRLSWAQVIGLALGLAQFEFTVAAESWEESVRALAANQVALVVPAEKGQAAPRIEVLVGELDPRLRLAPCGRIEPFLPSGSKPWGRSRIGIRCASGEARWVVYVPVTVRVWAPAWVARAPLGAGHTLLPEDLAQAPVDWAETTSAVIPDMTLAVGRVLVAPLQAGQAVRSNHLRVRQWFAAGETVTVVTQGEGFRVASEAVAITPGIEGQSARVRIESGRVLTGTAVGDRRLEVPLS